MATLYWLPEIFEINTTLKHFLIGKLGRKLHKAANHCFKDHVDEIYYIFYTNVIVTDSFYLYILPELKNF